MRSTLVVSGPGPTVGRARWALGGVALLSLGFADFAPSCGGPRECWEGLRLGMLVDLALVDDYVEGGPYLGWVDISSGRPSCVGIDGLRVGTVVRFRLEETMSVGECVNYVGRPLSGVTGIDLSGDLRTGSIIGCQAPQAAGWWRLAAGRRPTPDGAPLGETARPGSYPPVWVFRWLSDSTGECFDEWVGELRAVPDPADGLSTAMDGGA